ncbi:DUF4145 domain-containing protein [Rugamonas rivuli]|uniref:DUF4145 domain-containing protein n=1 Tax=Rugamonas rivuli TaxID=2743358 RepID=A0A843SD03_9BURK|nr:DUF4145 domain-containing protein [Rugamonas rivuli]MQA20922.1 DUF4145 domain-containing protein [Rugamonas rivuli]
MRDGMYLGPSTIKFSNARGATVSFRHASWFSENQAPGEDGTIERLYPLRKESSLIARPFQNVPTALRRIYSESVDCFNSESNTLCAAGLRALVEGICSAQGIADGPVEVQEKGGCAKIVRRADLSGRIAGLHERGLLTKASADTLHEHRYLGNSAVHELARPADMELKLAVEILEHTLDALYEMPKKAAQLRSKRKL